ncbi:hypothetical protein JCGZ_20588 [Jatropha curcas]|uniref:RING-type E3 ubiquitin transferase n=1 Tax=Jatropha curcas TaxID=180498 RepID=A0A067JNH6_JATCU|nr:E3 ubiquitin-protein ligase RNF181 homolog [Jatropha curcas]KDP25432.1 hypothetical protein JCGZ_20588 [Jatropha curcas]
MDNLSPRERDRFIRTWLHSIIPVQTVLDDNIQSMLVEANRDFSPEQYLGIGDDDEETIFGDDDDEDLVIALLASIDYCPTAQPASQESIDKLKDVRIEKSDLDCSICLDELLVGSEAKCLPCSHVYHGNCIAEWLKNSNTCPLCRYSLPTDSS